MTSLTPELAHAIARVFALQQANRPFLRRTSANHRRATLRRLRDTLLEHRTDIQRALQKDFQKPPTESDLTELMPVLEEIRFTRKHLKRWMKPRRVRTPLLFLGTSSTINYEPRGTVLIISAWNYPLNLTIGPLVSALAAGNSVILKPSELTPNTARLMKDLLAGLFDESEVAVFEGDHTVAVELQRHPFDHIFFTGSPRVGSLVMKAAAEHLTSVTLELGGKSPCIVDETADVRTAALKLFFGKFANGGQTCIAPDYLFVHDSRHDALLQALRNLIHERYGATSSDRQASGHYARIIHSAHHDRLAELLEAAVADGARVAAGGTLSADTRYVDPTLLTDVPANSRIMQEEIFGPLFPILPYTNLEDVVNEINRKPNPLTMYIFSKRRQTIDYLLTHTSAGSTVVNDMLFHYAHPGLPFGGVNTSGIGKSHGHAGFLAFSNQRPVLRQRLKHPPLSFLYPPYTAGKQRLVNWLLRYF